MAHSKGIVVVTHAIEFQELVVASDYSQSVCSGKEGKGETKRRDIIARRHDAPPPCRGYCSDELFGVLSRDGECWFTVGARGHGDVIGSGYLLGEGAEPWLVETFGDQNCGDTNCSEPQDEETCLPRHTGSL